MYGLPSFTEKPKHETDHEYETDHAENRSGGTREPFNDIIDVVDVVWIRFVFV
jgi:hypothetical protein